MSHAEVRDRWSSPRSSPRGSSGSWPATRSRRPRSPPTWRAARRASRSSARLGRTTALVRQALEPGLDTDIDPADAAWPVTSAVGTGEEPALPPALRERTWRSSASTACAGRS